MTGLVLYGVTASMLVLAGLGLDPWDVLHQGLSRTFGLAIGTWAIIVSLLALIAWRALPQRLGVGTITNAILIGVVMDVMLSLVHPPRALPVRIALLVGGVAVNGIATGLYIGAGLGPGPRDGLSTGLVARGGYSMRVVRTSIELTVLLTGFLLGGTVGIGTVLYALAIGPITHVTIPALRIGRRSQPESRLPTPEAPAIASTRPHGGEIRARDHLRGPARIEHEPGSHDAVGELERTERAGDRQCRRGQSHTATAGDDQSEQYDPAVHVSRGIWLAERGPVVGDEQPVRPDNDDERDEPGRERAPPPDPPTFGTSDRS